MKSLNLHLLSPNKNQKRFFGVDYFLNILGGSNPNFKYYSTPLDQNPVYNDSPITFLPEYYDFLDIELQNKDAGSIIGIQNNPDIYDGLDSLDKILKILSNHKMGLYLETTSIKILNDLDILEEFGKNNPLLISIPSASLKKESKLYGANYLFENTNKILSKIKNYDILCGLIIKPIIPYINDDLEDFKAMIKRAISLNVDYIYPSFSIKFDSKKIKAFYDIIDKEFPELMVTLHEEYGMKHVWESPNMSELKKLYVFECRKNKVKYALKDIVNLYKPDLNIQMKLF